jgi:hypothetical protein
MYPYQPVWKIILKLITIAIKHGPNLPVVFEHYGVPEIRVHEVDGQKVVDLAS